MGAAILFPVVTSGAMASVETTRDTWLVAIQGPMDRIARGEIAKSGGRIVGFFPPHSYVVRALPAQVENLSRGSGISGIERRLPLQKIAARMERSEEPRLVIVEVFEGERVAPVAEAARRLGALVLEEWDTPRVRRLLVRAHDGILASLSEVPEVEWIEDAPRPTLRNDVVRWVIQSNIENETPLYERGLFGEGQILGHIDDRIAHLMCFFFDPVVVTPGPTHRKLVSYHTTRGFGANGHGTHTAGTLAGDQEPVNGSILFRGMAPKARIAYADVFDVDEPDTTICNLDSLLTVNHDEGARIHSNSWGDDRFKSYTALCCDIDLFSHDYEDDLVFFATTNWPDLRTPENAKNAIAVGATQRPPGQEFWGSGGYGPTIDGRRKPEVMAPGINTQSASAFECTYSTCAGTSMACPAAAGGAALVREYFVKGYYPVGSPDDVRAFTPSGALVKAMMIQSAKDMWGEPGYPTLRAGWGRILLDDALFFPGDDDRLWVRDVRHAEGLDTGETHTYTVRIEDGTLRLRVTLAYMDAPASPGANPATVNDLDLELEGGGDLYLGNVFNVATGVSETGGTADPLNNVERSIVASPAEEEWTVRVRGAEVPLGPQGYALVVNGGLFHLTRLEQEAPVVPSPPRLPTEVSFSAPRPNPFSSEAHYELALPQDARVRVAIYDVSGRLVRVLVDRSLSAGRHTLSWDGRDEKGRSVPAGIYFTRFSTLGSERQVKGVLLR
jgi:subtilisin family serine protease